MTRRLSRATTAAFVAIMLASTGVSGAAPKEDPVRPGPADGPRGKSHRVAATDDTTTLPEYWVESPRIETPGKGGEIAGHYIVVFHPGTPGVKSVAEQITKENGGQLKFVYEHALQGFSGVFPEGKLDALQRNPNVLSIEPDRVAGVAETQTGATWGLDRTDQRDLPLDGAYTDGTEGAGVHAYVIDTGILLTHQEFSGRMGNGYDAVTAGGMANDCNGHGTHVAGSLGGTTYGVADKVTLHAVRVLDCNGSGTNSGVIAGVDWVRANAVRPAVANISLGGGATSALDTAVTNAINAGITFAVASGNDNANACNYSPARVAAAITVGATTNTDNRSSFSNYGTCLDIFAVGSNITSAWHTGSTHTNTISGTSMASPHTAGVAALYLAANPTATPTQVRNALVDSATPGKVINAGTGSPNVLLYSGVGAPPPPPPPPTSPLINGGFENGTTGWTQTSSGGFQLIDTIKPRSGAYGVWMGGYNNATETIGQAVTIPSNGSLRYYWHLTSSESTATPYDYLRVRVYDATTGALLATLRTFSNTSVRNVWSLDTISLAAYAGQTVRLQFAVSTDSSVTSSFFIDDVSVG